MHLKSYSLKVINTIFLLLVAIYVLLNANYSHVQRKTAKDHQIPFSLRRLVRREYQVVASLVTHKITWIKYECQYIYAQFVEHYKVLPPALHWSTSQSLEKLRIRPNNEKYSTSNDEYKETFAKLIQPLQPTQQKVAKQIQQNCLIESARLNKMAKHFVITQTLEWYRLIYEWNAELTAVKDKHPYQYRESVNEQKLAFLSLYHKRRLTLLKIHKLHQYQERQILTLKLATTCTKFYQDSSYDTVVKYIDCVTTQKYHDLKIQMHTQLDSTKDSLKFNVEKSFKTLNESIFIDKGQYHHVLLPDNHYTLVVNETNWRSLIETIESMWDEPVRGPMTVWSMLKLCYAYVYAIVIYLRKVVCKFIQSFQLSES